MIFYGTSTHPVWTLAIGRFVLRLGRNQLSKVLNGLNLLEKEFPSLLSKTLEMFSESPVVMQD